MQYKQPENKFVFHHCVYMMKKMPKCAKLPVKPTTDESSSAPTQTRLPQASAVDNTY